MLITSAKRQTTRQQLRCILTGPDYQIIFVDTPGLHTSRTKLGEFMVKEIQRAMASSDLVLYVQDAAAPSFPALPGLPATKPVVLALNKSDLLSPHDLQQLVAKSSATKTFSQVTAVSATTGDNLPQLLSALTALLPPGGPLYPADQTMDCDYRLLAAELIREQALLQLQEEVPHGVAIEITAFREGPDATTIEANVIVERQSHKGIVIGRGGGMLKAIGTAARQELQMLLATTVHLKLWVKVKSNWRKDPNQLKWLGYK